MADPNHIVVQGPDSTDYRIEIHDLVKDEKLFTLYIRALQCLEDVAEVEDPSFFGVGGIHGLPFVTWNDAQGSFKPPDDPESKWTFGGYCTHGDVLFPTWHRPYVVLYEQLLQSHATKIAAKFRVNEQDWALAALRIRQPYWDWAKYPLPPDEVIRDSEVTIVDFDGKHVSVENPLLRYKFKANLPLVYFKDAPDFANWQTTLRYPDKNGKEHIDEMVRVLTGGYPKTTKDLIFLLLFINDWDGFSNHTSTENEITNSLEKIHDNLHVQIGGITRYPGNVKVLGHMADPAVAGFDPIFYLHHCNIDRVLYLWYMLHNVWVSSGKAPIDGTFTLSPDASVNDRTDLSPFWKTTSTFWKSFQVRDTTSFGYKYADFKDIDTNDPEAVKKKIRDIIREYYKSLEALVSEPAQGRPNYFNNWTVRIRVKHYELGRSFSVLVFMGPVPEDSTQWSTSPNLVDAEHMFVNSAAFACANCRSQSDAVTEGFIHINDFIAKHHPTLAGYEEDVIKPHLKKHLSWRVLDARGQPVELSSLEVTVLVFTINGPISGDELPTLGQVQYHHDITRGKPGGSRE